MNASAPSFSEQQIFRIDHYLGKETVQNLLALRFGNTLFEPLWRRGRVQHVQITVAEDIGVERRAQFYDQTGALRDMVQNHLLQLLCIIAMEPPATCDPDAMRDEKLKVLRALRPLVGRDVLQNTVRGQYKAGAAGGKPVVGYLEEKDVPAGSTTETFVALKVRDRFVALGRRAVLPAYRQAPPGKAVRNRRSRSKMSRTRFTSSRTGPQGLNRLVIQLQPVREHQSDRAREESGRRYASQARRTSSLDFADAFKTRQLDAYERLLTDVIKGVLTLFMRRDELDAAWAWIDPIHEAWRAVRRASEGLHGRQLGPCRCKHAHWQGWVCVEE